jgi:hypothetical protein
LIISFCLSRGGDCSKKLPIAKDCPSTSAQRTVLGQQTAICLVALTRGKADELLAAQQYRLLTLTFEGFLTEAIFGKKVLK